MAATVKQLNFINQLVSEREVGEVEAAKIFEICAMPEAEPRTDISKLIDGLMKLPKKGNLRVNVLVELGLEKSMYAIPRDEVPVDLHGLMGGNDHLFVVIAEYRGTVYMRQLHGAPGSFSRSKIPAAQVKQIAHLLDGNTQRYTQLFGTLYSCCGSCGAELTDVTSRALKLGPDCRKKFGL